MKKALGNISNNLLLHYNFVFYKYYTMYVWCESYAMLFEFFNTKMKSKTISDFYRLTKYFLKNNNGQFNIIFPLIIVGGAKYFYFVIVLGKLCRAEWKVSYFHSDNTHMKSTYKIMCLGYILSMYNKTQLYKRCKVKFLCFLSFCFIADIFKIWHSNIKKMRDIHI